MQVHKQSEVKESHKETETSSVPHADHKSGDELKAELDALLDEIDDVLEENAEQFVADYVQKGGQ